MVSVVGYPYIVVAIDSKAVSRREQAVSERANVLAILVDGFHDRALSNARLALCKSAKPAWMGSVSQTRGQQLALKNELLGKI